MFQKLSQEVKVTLLVAKVLDEFLIAGESGNIDSFLRKRNAKLEQGEAFCNPRFRFFGCRIETQIDGSIKVAMHEYLERINYLNLSRSIRHEPTQAVDDQKRSEYRSLGGTLIYLGQAVLPQVTFLALKINPRLGTLRVGNLNDAKSMLKELHLLNPVFIYR